MQLPKFLLFVLPVIVVLLQTCFISESESAKFSRRQSRKFMRQWCRTEKVRNNRCMTYTKIWCKERPDRMRWHFVCEAGRRLKPRAFKLPKIVEESHEDHSEEHEKEDHVHSAECEHSHLVKIKEMQAYAVTNDFHRRTRGKKATRWLRRDRKRRRQKSEQSHNDQTKYWEGDVRLTEKQAHAMENMLNGRFKRKVAAGVYTLWTLPVTYQIAAGVPQRTRNLILSAIDMWEKNTCVKFKTVGPEVNRIEFYNGPGCSSFVGQVGGTQEISIHTPGCDYVGIISHEIGHALGFFHEQSRYDRDQYININLNNVDWMYRSNFIKAPPSDMNFYDNPYDYGSVMHYDAFSFATNPNQPSIQSVQNGYESTMGQRRGPSFIDFAQVNKAYCSTVCPRDNPCLHGGYRNPNDCNICTCPTGYGGNRCETVEYSGCGGELEVYSDGDFVSSPNYPNRFPQGTRCVWRFKTEAGKKVMLKFVETFQLDCKDVCDENYVEIKGTTDFRRTGPRFCCQNPPRSTFASKTDEMILIFENVDKSGSGFKAKVWTDSTRRRPGGRRPAPRIVTPPPTPPPATVNPGKRPSKSEIFFFCVSDCNTFLSMIGLCPKPANTAVDGCSRTCDAWTHVNTQCSVSCGGCGKIVRQRRCDDPEACQTRDERRCNHNPCSSKTAFFENGQFHILLDHCCVGMFKDGRGQCTGLSSGVSGLINIFGKLAGSG